MNINQAKYILTILSEGSFSAAANKLFLSQSALSQTVHAVEQSIGGKVFEKRNHQRGDNQKDGNNGDQNP